MKKCIGLALALLMMSGGVVVADEGAVAPGKTFEVTVVLTADSDETNAIGFAGTAPEGWVVSGGNGDFTKLGGNTIETIWLSGISEGESLTATFQVAIPEDAKAGEYSVEGYFEYYVGAGGEPLIVTTGVLVIVESLEIVQGSEAVAMDEGNSKSVPVSYESNNSEGDSRESDRAWIESHGGTMGIVSEMEAIQRELEWTSQG